MSEWFELSSQIREWLEDAELNLGMYSTWVKLENMSSDEMLLYHKLHDNDFFISETIEKVGQNCPLIQVAFP